MRTIKLDVNSLEKARDHSATEIANKNIREFRKKLIVDRPFKGYEPEITPIVTKQNSPNRTAPGPRESLHKDQIIYKQQYYATEQNQKSTKSSVKLPTIHYRGMSKTPIQNGSPDHLNPVQTREETDQINGNARLTVNGSVNGQRHKNSLKETNQPPKEKQVLSSFIRYIQIKPVKPTEKSPPPKNEVSLRDLKPLKIDKTLPIKMKHTSQKSEGSIKLKKKTSQKISRSRRTQEKSQKVISSYSMKKERRVLSISQPTKPMRKQKMTNTYWDFCKFICLLNKTQRPTTPSATYKAFVGKGNNSILIKNSLKNRFWWNIVDSDNQVNLFWTQCKDAKFIQTLKCSEEEKIDQMEESTRKASFNIPKEANERAGNENIKDYIGGGLNKFLSNEQKKRLTKNQWQAQVPIQSDFKKLGNPNKIRAHNHLEFHWHISNKKALYYNLKKFYQATKQNPFQYIPLTFHVQKYGDEEWQNFVAAFKERGEEIRGKQPKIKKKKEKNLWIVKPGENSNQGNGIQVYDSLEEIAEMVKNSGDRGNGKMRSYIVQRYLMPFLYNKRKFDIRCYVLVTSVNNIIKAYWYEEGYIRTSSKQFTLKNLKNRLIHLTNDAVQKKSQDYGKYENGNKVSFADFQRYLDNSYQEKNLKFFNTIYPAMIKRAADTIKSACMLMDSKKREYTFEIFGLDYMIDDEFNTWLIQVNTNPCLELGSPLLARIIPNMIQNALKIAVDPFFPPPKDFPKTKAMPSDLFETNKFTLIFNSSEEQEILAALTKDSNLSNIVQSDEQDENHDDIE